MGGATNAFDSNVVGALAEVRSQRPEFEAALASLTHLGGGVTLIGAATLGALALLLRKQFRECLFLILSTVGARFMIELVKFVVERPRPAFDEHPVYTTNFSFPSGHAGNSMATFLALAWFLSPPEQRKPMMVVGVCASLVIGMTRPVLGVHWPSDIIAGWAFGALWVWLMVKISERGAGAA